MSVALTAIPEISWSPVFTPEVFAMMSAWAVACPFLRCRCDAVGFINNSFCFRVSMSVVLTATIPNILVPALMPEVFAMISA